MKNYNWTIIVRLKPTREMAQTKPKTPGFLALDFSAQSFHTFFSTEIEKYQALMKKREDIIQK